MAVVYRAVELETLGDQDLIDAMELPAPAAEETLPVVEPEEKEVLRQSGDLRNILDSLPHPSEMRERVKSAIKRADSLRDDHGADIDLAAYRYRIDPKTLTAAITVHGLGSFNDTVAARLGLKISGGEDERQDPKLAIEAHAKHIAEIERSGFGRESHTEVIAAHEAGPRQVVEFQENMRDLSMEVLERTGAALMVLDYLRQARTGEEIEKLAGTLPKSKLMDSGIPFQTQETSRMPHNDMGPDAILDAAMETNINREPEYRMEG